MPSMRTPTGGLSAGPVGPVNLVSLGPHKPMAFLALTPAGAVEAVALAKRLQVAIWVNLDTLSEDEITRL